MPVYNTVFLMVKEKETRTKESMKMMGLTFLPYWLSWFVFYSLQSTILSLVAWGMIMINVVNNSSPGYIFCFYWLFGQAVFGQIVVLQALFNKSKYAGLVSSLIYFGLSFIAFTLSTGTPTGVAFALASLIP